MLSFRPALSEKDVKRIHSHRLDEFQNVGINNITPKALEILEDWGCKVECDHNWASIPLPNGAEKREKEILEEA
jgi:trimethylamine:corrinoid methyltransferase-like protein